MALDEYLGRVGQRRGLDAINVGQWRHLFNDTGARYNAEQAAAAYSAVLDWFGKYLGPAS